MGTSGPGIRYDDLEPGLRTGDIFLFHGTSEVSRRIEAITGCPFSHSGMVYRPDPAKPPLLWESVDTAVVVDPITNTKHAGAQLGLLRDCLVRAASPDYGDTPYVRQLTVARSPDMEAAVRLTISDLDGRPFPSEEEMFAHWLEGQLYIVAPDTKLFCAQLVATTYMRMGLLPFSPPPNSYSPKVFAEAFDRVPFLKGAKLGPQLQVMLT